MHHPYGARVVGGPRGVPIAGARPGQALDIAGPALATERCRPRLERRPDIGADDDETRLAERVRVDVRGGLLDAMPKPLAELSGVERRRLALRIHRLA